LGIVLGVIGVVPGVAALAVAAPLVVAVLAAASVAAGAAAAYLDYGPCFRDHDHAACVGFWAGFAGVALGSFGVADALGLAVQQLDEEGLLHSILQGLGGAGVVIGAAGAAVDTGAAIAGKDPAGILC
jgi:hypothetical protein